MRSAHGREACIRSAPGAMDRGRAVSACGLALAGPRKGPSPVLLAGIACKHPTPRPSPFASSARALLASSGAGAERTRPTANFLRFFVA